jgi:6-phospho-3-hexuloisomerase
MSLAQFELAVVDEIRSVVARLDERRVEALVDALLSARRVFVGGAGRSGFVTKAFAMRLMHLGLSAHAVGETITPGIELGDLLVVGTGSGQTRTTLAVLQAAATRGARTAAITAHPLAPVPAAADIVLEIPSPITGHGGESSSAQPPGSLFEQCLLVVCDALVMRLMERLGTTHDEMRARHTKLE